MDRDMNDIIGFVIGLINKLLEYFGFDLRLQQSEQGIV